MMWSIGNESEAGHTDADWTFIQDVAAMIHELDTCHPTTITFSNSDVNKITPLKNKCPDIDILTINSYYPSVGGVNANVQAAGWDKPWMMGEFGPRGTWAMGPEANRILPWTYLYQNAATNALIEETSTQKEAIYLSVMQNDVLPHKTSGCIGSMVFVWGFQSHGEVLNWYGMLDKKGNTYGCCDAMQYAWTGSYPANRAPVIQNRHALTMNGHIADDAIYVTKNSDNTATVVATDRENDPLTYEWLIMKEGTASTDGSLPDCIEGLITSGATLPTVAFKAPNTVGAYRIYVFVRDNHNKVASAVIPFYVND
jgi:hypothetical protein